MSATPGVELLEAVRQFLRQEVLPELDGFKAYTTRVAANARGIVVREMQMGAGLAELDAQIATTLGLDVEGGCGHRVRPLQTFTKRSEHAKKTVVFLPRNN